MRQFTKFPRPPPDHAASLVYRANLREVRDFVRSRAARAGLRSSRACDLVLAVSELAANTLRHTDSDGLLQVWSWPGEIICQIRDSGHLPERRAGRPVLPPTEDGHGHGLRVVHQVCDCVEICTGVSGTTIRLHMQLDA